MTEITAENRFTVWQTLQMTEVPAEKCLLPWQILEMMEYLQKASYLSDILYKWP
jgi:hypothetical protein